MNPALEEAALDFEKIAQELEVAAKHARVVAGHMRAGEVPRAGAHAFALLGHLKKAEALIEQRAIIHAEKSIAQ